VHAACLSIFFHYSELYLEEFLVEYTVVYLMVPFGKGISDRISLIIKPILA